MFAAVGLLVVACQSSEGAGRKPRAGISSPMAPTANVSITPADGTGQARPDKGISVTAAAGPLGTVQVTVNGVRAEGELTADGTRWQSRWPLAPGKTYQVTATATGEGGKVTTLTSQFTTTRAQQTISASVTGPADGARVGVGMPIILNFSQPVYNRAEIERALEVQASTRVEGAWRWMGDQQVIFRPRTYWPTGERVTLIAHLNGARAAKNVYGTKDLRLRFTVGDALISTVNTKNYTMTVRRNGKLIRKMPISAGKATERRFTTTNGIHVVSEKVSPVVFDSATVGIPKGDPAYYKIKGYWAVRISDSGEYAHSAPWSVPDQGKRNVSHGCVNVGPANAKWFYQLSRPGDVVIVTGTNRQLEPDNGWGYWQLSWKEWASGSALKRSLTTNPTI
ncbi:Ig-like domain-containing protein [Actinomadura scrupuli]|uniref:L,D-transpeptidase n=1 Tax=Actinomadura scrupuli TaxID=559629 RepID=UPI003D967089